MSWRRVLVAGCVMLASAPAGQAEAVTCTLAVSPLTFGSYNPLSPVTTDTASSIQITCNTLVSVLVTYSVSLSSGGGTLRDRRLTGDRFSLAYQLYTDSARSQVWGDGTSGTAMSSSGYLLAAVSSITTNLTGYGRIPPRQNVGPGSYSDTLMATITY